MTISAPLLLRPQHLFDGRDFAPPGSAVLLSGARIEAVLQPMQAAAFEGDVLELPDATLLPGLTDCHTHVCFGAEPDVPAALRARRDDELAVLGAHRLRQTLRGGVTVVRDLGGRNGVDITLRNALARGELEGPLMRCAGRFVCMTGGHGCWVGREVDGVDDVRRGVREAVRLGADWVKLIATGGVLTRTGDPLCTQLSEEELRAGIKEAKRLALRVAVHAHGAHGIGLSVRAGADSIEHGFELTSALADEMVERGVFLVPTFSAVAAILDHASEIAPAIVETARRFTDLHASSFATFLRAGGRIALGTDAGTPFNRHGANARELLRMTERGMSNTAALRAGTSEAAKLLGLDDRGEIAAGRTADLLLVRGNARENISCVAERDHHLAVLQAGRLVQGHRLARQGGSWHRLLEHVPATGLG